MGLDRGGPRTSAAAGSDEGIADFGRLYAENIDAVRSYFLRRIRVTHVADDLSAEVFEEAFGSMNMFDIDRGTPRQWLMGIARNRLRRFWQGVARLAEIERRLRLSIYSSPVTNLDDDFESVEWRAIAGPLRAEIRRLPQRYRAALEMRFMSGSGDGFKDYEDVARSLGCSVAAARVQVHRGLRVLRDRLIAEGDGPWA